MQVLGALVLTGLAILLLDRLIFQRLAEEIDKKRYPPPGRMVKAGDHSLHLNIQGERQGGAAVVVLEAGPMFWSFHWRQVQPVLAKRTRVIAYDRAGLGWSQEGPRPRSPEQIASELHTALHTAGESGPFVLVGHSFGGVYIQQFASMFPDETAGLVLIDSTNEHQFIYLPEELNTVKGLIRTLKLARMAASVGILRLAGRQLLLSFAPSLTTKQDQNVYAALASRPQFFRSALAELQDVLPRLSNEENMDWPDNLKDIPLAVIQANYMDESFFGYTQETRDFFLAGWKKVQLDFLTFSEDSHLIKLPPGQNSLTDDPDAIISAVNLVFSRAAIVDLE